MFGGKLRVVRDGPPELETLGDDDLMRLARANREDAFAALVRRHQSLVLGLATRFFGDRAQGRDVSQDVFLALWSERARYEPRGRFRSYLISMTYNRCRHVARGQRRLEVAPEPQQSGEAATASDAAAPLEALVERERAREVRTLLPRLPEKTRQVVILRFTHDLPLAEIAELLDMPLGTVKSHVHRGLKRLHGLLTEGAR